MDPAVTAPPPSRESPTEAMLALFTAQGLERAEPAILQPADVFLDLSGEDIRRRLYLVQDPAGRELCLRPDYTIPVSRDHLARGQGTEPAGYCYLGPVFRFRPEQAAPGEFLQAGIERFGETDREAADAGLIALALQTVACFGQEAPAIRLGDPGLVMAFVAALDLPEPWPRRLRAGFGREGGIAAVVAGTNGQGTADRTGFLAALGRGEPAAARAAVEEMVSLAGIAPVGGRGPQEIAERLIEQARLAADGGLPDDARSVLQRVAAVSGTPGAAHDELATIAADAGLDLAASLDAFARRNALMETMGVDLDRVAFEAGFGRRLDYYTGFVFELFDPDRPVAPVVGGGRYDRLLSMLGAPEPVQAVGCSMWIDRLTGGDAP